MKNRKIILDRGYISSKEIADRQNFDDLLKSFKAPPNPYWKSIWFWGTTGVASLGLFFLTKQLFSENESLTKNIHEENITLALDGLPKDTECIKAPIFAIDVPFETFEINPAVDNLLTLNNGSTINIKAGSIETLTSGNVVIKTRVFEDKTSAFLAGIPMDYKNSAFESAGMIEVRGEQAGKPVTIKQDTPIEISLKLFKDHEGFDFFALDDKSGKWDLYPCEYSPSGETPSANFGSPEAKAITKSLNSELQTINKNIAVKDAELNQLVLPKKETFYLPKNEKYIFTLDYNKRDFPELAALGRINFEAYPNQSNYENIFKKSWANFIITEVDGKYKVTFSDKVGAEELTVRPIVTGVRLEEAMEEYNEAKEAAEADRVAIANEREELIKKRGEKNKELQNYISAMEEQYNVSNRDYIELKREQELKELNQMQFINSIVNSASANFRTSQFGVFNSDKPVAYPKPFENEIRFEIAGNTIAPKAVYVFDLDKDVRYQFGSKVNPLGTFGMTSNDNVIMIILEDNEVAYAHTNKTLVRQSGKIQLNVIPANQVTEKKIKSVLNEERVSA
jgi:hypothetical protein